jgi:hypothetical protein
MTWQVIFPAGPAAEVRTAFEEWLAARQGPPLAEQQIRFDLIRSGEGELLRILIDADPLDEDEPP